ncbi:hypothetical protein IMG5_162040 [Ichthyophthirius multifiliis]|uniref:Ethanolaminephosphotransferase n=1 Tax=Ichthyophthirius multifiliis TaxID=5932 RepID=G0R051_ICHMU|nr:hypothetical protein IMG5_162040 [Ichthyophthirius multifiliis]EGR29150.1 hypothetical protein IMG5_162040 [Ichthyophthirius multifiliis]|eukprot:XP_004030386.1 hypothetical protein IMG5_162040 [Ichthyophthirius multifiliis]
MISYNFISKENENNLIKYQYKGRDNSILYNYVFGPIAESFQTQYKQNDQINIFNINIIILKLTLCGYLCVIIPHLVLWYMFPNELSGNIPRSLCAFIGIMHLIYMNFDNVDGKQARKTGNSSPLGLLFDHGCDALVVSVQGISLAACMGFGNTYNSYLVYASGAIPFFITTIDEYYNDFMYLPWINGASEGCLAVGLFILFSAAFGPQWWGEEIVFGQTKRQVTLYFFLFAGIVTSLNIFKKKYVLEI